MRTLFLLLSLFAFSLNAADVWQCPMHCEGTKTYAAPGTCPVCHMKLEKLGAPAVPLNTRDYRVDREFEPKPLRAGVKTKLTLYARHTKDGSALKVPMQATLFSDNLGEMKRLPLETLPDGGHRTTLDLLKGEFTLFVEFSPEDGPRQIFPITLTAEGTGELPKLGALELSPKTVKEVAFSFVPKSSHPADCLLVNVDKTYFERVPAKRAGKQAKCHAHPPAGKYHLWYEGKAGDAIASFIVQ